MFRVIAVGTAALVLTGAGLAGASSAAADACLEFATPVFPALERARDVPESRTVYFSSVRLKAFTDAREGAVEAIDRQGALGWRFQKLSRWSRRGEDAVSLVWSDARYEVRMELHPTNTGFAGTATRTLDPTAKPEQLAVEAQTRTCPAVP